MVSTETGAPFFRATTARTSCVTVDLLVEGRPNAVFGIFGLMF
jgi:hypothetical protein